MMPTIAVLDPELTTSMPPHLTAATGADALVHNLEAFIMDTFHPFADGIAKEGIQICVKSLPVAVKDGKDIKARGEMLMASAMGATAFQKGLGLNHSIAHALGVFYDLHHGLANAAVLIEVMKFNIKNEKVKTKIASLGTVFETENSAEKVIDKMKEWLDLIGMSKTLSELSVKQNQFQQIEDYALEDPCCPLNPRKVEKGDVVQILKKLL
jgi:alcohol dehydrogenase class IV